MATNSDKGDDATPTAEGWSDDDRKAAIEVERKCGISLVPDGVDD